MKEVNKMKRTSEEFWQEYCNTRSMAEREQKRAEWYQEMEVGDHAHICHWTDVSPCTVIKRTPTSITVRYDKATRKETWKPEFVTGGFSAVCLNNADQDDAWDIEEDENGRIEVFRWSKKYNRFRNKSGERVYPEWKKFYDYNF